MAGSGGGGGGVVWSHLDSFSMAFLWYLGDVEKAVKQVF